MPLGLVSPQRLGHWLVVLSIAASAWALSASSHAIVSLRSSVPTGSTITEFIVVSSLNGSEANIIAYDPITGAFSRCRHRQLDVDRWARGRCQTQTVSTGWTSIRASQDVLGGLHLLFHNATTQQVLIWSFPSEAVAESDPAS